MGCGAIEIDLAIIGGGILGVSLAYHLSKTPLKILVIEKETGVAHHASGKNAGMIRHAQNHPQLEEWVRASIATWPEPIKEKTYIKTGSVIVDPDGEKRHFANDGLLDGGTFVASLAALAKGNGVKFRFDAKVESVKTSNNSSSVIRLNGGETVQAQQVVIAAGAWSEHFEGRIYARFANNLPFGLHSVARHLTSVRGFRASLSETQGVGFYWDEVIGIYLRHWSSVERIASGCDSILTPPDTQVREHEAREELAEKLMRMLVDQLDVSRNSELTLGRTWCCLRTFTRGNLPLIGRDPGHPALLWLTGFGGWGMSAGFAAAAELAAEIGEGKSDISSDMRPNLRHITATSLSIS